MTRLSQHVLLWTLIVHFLTFVERENVKSTFCFNINGWVVLVWFTLLRYLYLDTEVRIMISSGMKKAKISRNAL